MNRKQKVAVVVTLALLMVGAVSCGKESEPTTSPSAPAGEAEREAYEQQVRAHAYEIDEGIHAYYLQYRKVPQTLEMLTEVNPQTGAPWIDKIPRDPWGRPYVYEPLRVGWQIISAGEDGQEGTEDDIRWPVEER